MVERIAFKVLTEQGVGKEMHFSRKKIDHLLALMGEMINHSIVHLADRYRVFPEEDCLLVTLVPFLESIAGDSRVERRRGEERQFGFGGRQVIG